MCPALRARVARWSEHELITCLRRFGPACDEYDGGSNDGGAESRGGASKARESRESREASLAVRLARERALLPVSHPKHISEHELRERARLRNTRSHSDNSILIYYVLEI